MTSPAELSLCDAAERIRSREFSSREVTAACVERIDRHAGALDCFIRTMYDSIRSALDGDEFSVVERFEIPGRTPGYAPVPKFLFDSRAGLHLGRQWGGELWAHQAQALDALGRGDNVVVSTSTASGKMPDFQIVRLSCDTSQSSISDPRILSAQGARGGSGPRMAGNGPLARTRGNVRRPNRRLGTGHAE